MTVEGVGRVEYFEFETDIWMWNIFSDKRGSGSILIRKFIEYAKNVNKDIYGHVNPIGDKHMNTKRIMRWYELLGAKRIQMRDHPFAMKLEIRK